jgi:cellulose biosynthesis protein BcsQ
VSMSILPGDCTDFQIPILVRSCQNIVDHPEHLLAAIIVPLVAVVIVTPIRTWLWHLLRLLFGFIGAGWEASKRLDGAEDSVSPKGRGPWLAIKLTTPPDYHDRMESAVTTTPVVVCANLKGGVGKTTITANIAASFARKMQSVGEMRPVLAVDLDYQGSLSSMLFVGTRQRLREGDLSPASRLVEGLAFSNPQPVTWMDNPDIEQREQRNVQQVPGLMGVNAYYDLADTEDRVRVLWAIGEQTKDPRYFLYQLLHSDAFRSQFSMVFIDAPPRLTTGCVQALVASTHLLIPTILDELSADAVAYFARQLVRYEDLWPHLRVLGIIGSMADLTQRYQLPALRTAVDRLKDKLSAASDSSQLKKLFNLGIPYEFPTQLFVKERAYFGRSIRKGIAYATLGNTDEGREVRSLFDGIAEEIRGRLR